MMTMMQNNQAGMPSSSQSLPSSLNLPSSQNLHASMGGQGMPSVDPSLVTSKILQHGVWCDDILLGLAQTLPQGGLQQPGGYQGLRAPQQPLQQQGGHQQFPLDSQPTSMGMAVNSMRLGPSGDAMPAPIHQEKPKSSFDHLVATLSPHYPSYTRWEE